jgi:hypothetical protein
MQLRLSFRVPTASAERMLTPYMAFTNVQASSTVRVPVVLEWNAISLPTCGLAIETSHHAITQ